MKMKERIKRSVRRWDGIAGRCDDWETCQKLLEVAVVTSTKQDFVKQDEVFLSTKIFDSYSGSDHV